MFTTCECFIVEKEMCVCVLGKGAEYEENSVIMKLDKEAVYFEGYKSAVSGSRTATNWASFLQHTHPAPWQI